MTDTLKKVLEFNNAFDIEVAGTPTLPELDEDVKEELDEFACKLETMGQELMGVAKFYGGSAPLLRLQLLVEEVGELARAMEQGNMVEMLDAICDIQYVLDGATLSLGLQDVFLPAFEEVHNSNMSKLVDGKPVKNEAGRVTKGPSYYRPKLAQFLAKDK